MEKQKNSSTEHSRSVPHLRFPEFNGKWEKKKLGEHIELLSGVAIKGNEITEDKSGIPILRGINITEGFIRHTEEIDRYFKCDNKSEYNKYLIKVNDLVLGMDGSKVGKNVALVKKEDEDSILIQRVARIRANEKSNIHFIFQNIFSKKFHDYVDIVNTSSGIPHISSQQIKDFIIGFPSLPEQTKIASFLTAVDEKIQALKKKKSLLEKYKKGVMQQIFTQELRFKDDNGNDFKAWEEKKLGEVCDEHQLKNKNKETSEVFSVAKHKGVINQIEHLGRSFSAKEILHYKLIYPGDLVYTKSPTSDFPFGIIKQNRTGRLGVVSPLYCVFKPKTYALGYLLHEYFISSINTYNYLSPLVQKGAKNTMNINNYDFLNGASFLLPMDEAEQTKIAHFLSAIDDKINAVQQQIEKTEVWKKGLLQKMFV